MEAKKIIKKWAEENTMVNRVWLYGSRVKKTEKDESDLDVAVELKPEFGLADFICEKESWIEILQQYIPYKLDIKLYRDAGDCICKMGVNEASILVYENAL